MNIRAFLIVILKAPYYAVVGAVLGLMIAALVLLANFLVHLAAGIEQGTVSQAIHMTAKYLPLVMAAGGFIAGFMPNTNLGTAVFGSARWANRKELDKLTQQTGGLLIGRDSSTGKLLRYDGPAHLLTMAPTRTGKGVGTIIPNLLTADRSVICIDPKGENAKVTRRARQMFGPVHILDPSASPACPPQPSIPSIRSIRTASMSQRTQAPLLTRSSSMSQA